MKEKKLPDHVEKLAKGGYACMACGGEVDESGSPLAAAYGEEDDEKDSDVQSKEMDDQLHKALFSKAVRSKS